MVSGAAVRDAVSRAKRLPALGVGLHLVLVNGRPTSAREDVSELVGPDGNFRNDLFAAGVRFFASPKARRQLEAEIRAQFRAFAETGLRLDHVNAHNHMHVHPTVFAAILRVGRDFGMPALRFPYEPFVHPNVALRVANALLFYPWLGSMKARMRAAGVSHNDAMFGLGDTGGMNPARVRALLEQLPEGTTEIYFHPDVGNADFAALCDSSVADAVRSAHVVTTTFSANAA